MVNFCSRFMDIKNASAFAQDCEINQPSVGEELAKSDEVDAVYIATPHSSHAENSIFVCRIKAVHVKSHLQSMPIKSSK